MIWMIAGGIVLFLSTAGCLILSILLHEKKKEIRRLQEQLSGGGFYEQPPVMPNGGYAYEGESARQEAYPSYEEQPPILPNESYAETGQDPLAQKTNGTLSLSYYNQTSVLNPQMLGNANTLVRLKRQKTGETIFISKPSFWVGKEEASVDYCITDNTNISRRHVLFFLENGVCYVRDNASKNGSFLNGKRLTPQEDTALSNNDTLRLANEDFTVYCGN